MLQHQSPAMLSEKPPVCHATFHQISSYRGRLLEHLYFMDPKQAFEFVISLRPSVLQLIFMVFRLRTGLDWGSQSDRLETGWLTFILTTPNNTNIDSSPKPSEHSNTAFNHLVSNLCRFSITESAKKNVYAVGSHNRPEPYSSNRNMSTAMWRNSAAFIYKTTTLTVQQVCSARIQTQQVIRTQTYRDFTPIQSQCIYNGSTVFPTSD